MQQQNTPKSQKPAVRIRTLCPSIINSGQYLIKRLQNMIVQKAKVKNILLSMMSDVDHLEQSCPRLQRQINDLQKQLKKQQQQKFRLDKKLGILEQKIKDLPTDNLKPQRLKDKLNQIIQRIDEK